MHGTPRAGRRAGFALMAVLFVLLALLVLCAPFLSTARNADRASGELADKAQARLLLDGAGRHARARLAPSHPGHPDETPWWDSLEELTVDNRFDPVFLDARDASGAMWDLEVVDLAGRIDLNSANPQVLANVMGMATRTGVVLEADADRLEVRDPEAFDAEHGLVWIRGELIAFAEREGRELVELERGVGAREGDEGEWESDGPRPPTTHPIGAHVLDQRAFAPVVWRVSGPDDEPQALDALEQLREVQPFTIAGELPDAALAALTEGCTVHGGVAAGARWQRPVRLVAPVEGGKDQEIYVDDGRFVTDGSTVRIVQGDMAELRYVQRREGAAIVLNRVLEQDYDAWEAEVSVLAKRPVNLNTAPASVLEALFTNLQLRNQNSRIDEGEARALASLVTASRPFTGFEDFMRRVVLPAAGIEALPDDAAVVPAALESGVASIISPVDAMALYVNGLNANDGLLEFATMPYAFRSRDVYAMDLRAALNAESGIERTRARRERVELVVPQRELFTMWGTQEAFDEALRLDRRAAWWATGPSSTSRWDGGSAPPSRFVPHMGTFDGRLYVPGYSEPPEGADAGGALAEHVFAAREDQGWCQLWPNRLPEVWRWEGRTLHFDHETRDLEGRYLPDETVGRLTDDELVQWNDEAEGGLLRALSFEAWVKPTLAGDGILLDVGGLRRESDRVTLALEGPDLVLRVLDGFGDHRATVGFEERTELRYALAEGDVPGLPIDTWSHVSLDVSGTRPDQVGLLVNGSASGVRRLGLTRLTAAAPQGTGLLQVEDTEGFPDQGVVRIGNELIEYTLAGSNLIVQHEEAGENAGFGGRLARLRWNLDTGGNVVDSAFALDLGATTTDHPVGATVELYGYSAPLESPVPAGDIQLPADLGAFRVARVTGVADNEEDDMTFGLGGPLSADFGRGYEATNAAGLIIALADDPEGDPEGERVATGFNSEGGYAALVQRLWNYGGGDGTSPTTGAPLGGVEIVRYSGVQGNVLVVAARGDVAANELAHYPGQAGALSGAARTYVFDWEQTTEGAQGDLVQPQMTWGMYVVPLSLPVPGADAFSFVEPDPQGDSSEFAQLTHLDQAELTEWVRYDDLAVTHGQLVRDHEQALLAAYLAIVGPGRPGDLTGRPGGGAGGGGGGGGLGDHGGFGPGAPGPPPPVAGPPAGAPLGPAAAPAALGTLWDPLLGTDELTELPLTRAVSSALQFRGVLDTASHDHPAGTPVLPVVRLLDRGVEGGRPGARDAVFLSGPEANHLGWPLVVQRAVLPAPEYLRFTWVQRSEVPIAAPARPVTEEHAGFAREQIFVAFQEPSPEPIQPGGISGQETDTRLRSRLVKFPSGERPRVVARAAVGSAFDGLGAEVPAAVMDEVVFGTPTTFYGLNGAVPASHTQAAGFVLADQLAESDEQLSLVKRLVAVPPGLWGTGGADALDELPEDGGLLRIGDEILAYSDRDPATGLVRLAVGGRGLLGTRPQFHHTTEVAAFLEHWVVTTLASDVGAGDPFLPVAGLEGFPPQGTVLVDDELIHYTRLREGALEMPQASSEPGRRDGEGDGLFRGRYGTLASGHAAGTPVILFPFRYWDRWAERADAPELSWFGFELDQPGAWWQDTFWDMESAPHGQCRVGVLVRTDAGVPWDEDPALAQGLTLLWEGREDDGAVPLGARSDRIEWRVFVAYDPGAFDPQTGLSHGWRETPRLLRLGASYLAPGAVLRSVDR